ncbi:hypothetical protein GALMADRAFT_47912, partial [Galerina marginata CBS 339.88]
ECKDCNDLKTWWNSFNETVDDLLIRSNVHKCRASTLPKKNKRNKNPKGCLNKDGVCMARFPREIIDTTKVDELDGHIYLKKKESMMNTFTPTLTYLLRCNTDVSSLLSGTSIKAIISYVTDYVTKPTLKTHQIFSSAYDIYSKNSELLG